MKIKSNIVLTLSAFAGLVGAGLRKVEYNTALNGGAGIAEESSAVTIALIILTAAVIVCAAAAGAALKKAAGNGPAEPLQSSGVAAGAAGAVMMAAGSVIYYIETGTGFGLGILSFLLLGIAGAAGVFLMAKYAGTGNAAAKVLSVAPAVFCCLWMVLIYKDNSAEPQIIKFVYRCLAAAAQTMAFYYFSGYFYNSRSGGRAVFTGILAIYFSVMAISEAFGIGQALLLAGIAVGVADNLRRVVISLTK